MNARPAVRIRRLGRRPYQETWQAMRDFTDRRTPETTSEIWLLEHDPVFTLGQAARTEHLLAPGDIPVVNSDRGGQVTYHGPGQVVIYLLLSLREAGLGVRALVNAMEQSVIDLLADHDISAEARADAPGVYVAGAKIAALGLRIRRGYSYHGLAFNVNPDLEPFSRIDPCGYRDMPVTSTERLGIEATPQVLGEMLVQILCDRIGYRTIAT
ncbi:MAG: lipoyl(octanoyl) transferase LipB [Gammaproteobacteria bacterium]|nr:MAG: lipoyl(octanoyl) transferase LipB [Gammaproteobacteria bacterium]